MTHPIRFLEQADLTDAMELISRAFGGGHTPADDAIEIAMWEPDRFYGAYDGTQLVGTCGSFALEMTVPGGPRPVAGVSWVSVAPTHHRQGIARSLMRRQLDDLHAAGEPVAALWATEGAIYQRYGYGVAAWGLSASVPSKSVFNLPVPTGGLELVKPEAAQLSATFDHARVRRSGWYARSAAWWDYRLKDLEHHRRGASELFAVVSRSPYGVDGYALYSTTSDWAGGAHKGKVKVRELVGTSPEITARLWRYLLDLDLMGTVECHLSLDDPLLHLMGNPRTADARLADHLWVRLVDVPAALAARSYAIPIDVVLEVTDEFCPWNTGRFRLSGGPTGATCTPTESSADLQVSAGDLGAAYLGGSRLQSRAGSGHVVELTEGSLATASLAFNWSGPVAYCPMIF